MSFFITAIAAVVLGILYTFQTFSVIQIRFRDGVVLGDGENKALTKRIRGHANHAEQTPLFLILLGLSEASGSTPWLGIIAATFVIGRLMHGAYFLDIGLHHSFRRYGMMLSLAGQIAAILTLAILTLT